MSEKHENFSKSCLAPFAVSLVFLIVFGLLYVLVALKGAREQSRHLAADASATGAYVMERLAGNRDYLRLLAAQRGHGDLTGELFRKRASAYVAAHPELSHITWVASDFVVRDVAPFEANRRFVGLQLSRSEPARASRLARERRAPVYTGPYEALPGRPALDIWVPVFRENEFLGLFAGVHSCDGLLRHLVKEQLKTGYRVSLLTPEGTVVAGPGRGETSGTDEIVETLLPPSPLRLRLIRPEYRMFTREAKFLAGLCVALTLGMGFSIGRLRRDFEGRIKAEEARKTQEKLYRNVFFNNHTIMLLIDPETASIADANPTACAFYGASRNALRSKKITELNILPEAEVFEEMAKAINEERNHFHFVHRLVNGEEREVEVYSGPVEQSGRTFLLSIIHDVTDRNQAMDEIKKQAHVLNHMAEGVNLSDRDGVIQYTNPAFDRMFGYEKGELLGQHVSVLNDDRDSGEFVSEILETLKSDRHWKGEIRNRKKNETPFFTEALISALEFNGETKWIWVQEDVTEQREWRQRIVDSEERFRQFFESSPVGLWEEDFSAVKARVDRVKDDVDDFETYCEEHPEYLEECAGLVKILNVNRAACELHGAANKDELLAGLTSTFTEESYGAFRKGIHAIAKGETSLECDGVVRKLNGEELFVSIAWRVAPGHEASYSRVLVSLKDLTYRRHIEQRLTDAIHDRETLLRELHHRVKNNFQVVSSLLNLQSARSGMEPLRIVFGETQQRIRAMALIHEKLYRSEKLSHIESREYFQCLSEELVRSCQMDPRVSVVVELDSVLLSPDVAVPCGLILNELVTNALKHAFLNLPAGVLRIEFRKHTADKQGSDDGLYELSVRDDGCGITPEALETNEEHLGLQLVRSLARRQLGGELEVEREKGTVFRILFELADGRVRAGERRTT